MIQVVSSVLIPPHGDHGESSSSSSYVDGEEIAVEELMARLEPFVESEASVGEL